jgi:hypothetical protein
MSNNLDDIEAHNLMDEIEISAGQATQALGTAMIRAVALRVKNTVRAFVNFELTNTGIVICNCIWHRKGDREWIVPARRFEANDGAQRWSPIVEFAKGASKARKQFQDQALAAISAPENP